ncbi:hypothetical protein P3L10_021363 [Capsicum annuum]
MQTGADATQICSYPLLDSSPQDGGGNWSCNEETGDSVSGVFAQACHGVRGNEDGVRKADIDQWPNLFLF